MASSLMDLTAVAAGTAMRLGMVQASASIASAWRDLWVRDWVRNIGPGLWRKTVVEQHQGRTEFLGAN